MIHHTDTTVPPIRVERVRYVEDPSSWRRGFVCGFLAAAVIAAVLVKLILCPGFVPVAG